MKMATTQPDIRVSSHDGIDDFLHPDRLNAKVGRSRSTSVTPSIASRVTSIEDNADLVEPPEEAAEISQPIVVQEREYSWLDHLRGVLCMPIKRSKRPVIPATKPGKRMPQESPWVSPWILPVMVYSVHKEEGQNIIHHQAQCTIDTGNLQGNIVSRDFVFNTLGFAESHLLSLKEYETRPGMSITGHELHPEGAIYLTWYHKNSTRVFRNMRFLVSKHPQHDLIIGARSIEIHGLLSVPNLMNSTPNDIILPAERYQRDGPMVINARNNRTKWDKEVNKLEIEVSKAHRKGLTDIEMRRNTELKIARAEYEVAIFEVRLYENQNSKLEESINSDLEEAKKLRDKLRDADSSASVSQVGSTGQDVSASGVSDNSTQTKSTRKRRNATKEE